MYILSCHYFNPRTCTRCDATSRLSRTQAGNFNPRTCTRCDDRVRVRFRLLEISIHAPARGAIELGISNDVEFVFQSTHLHEVRSRRRSRPSDRRYFNPRTCTRCDSSQGQERHGVSDFNPRTCTRCDRSPVQSRPRPHDFNPRTCTRCDAISATPSVTRLYFNPRTCTRCDLKNVPYDGYVAISIHAPARGAMVSSTGYATGSRFQSTHLHEVRWHCARVYR